MNLPPPTPPAAGGMQPMRASLSALTTFRVGGKCLLLKCPDEETLRRALLQWAGEPITLIGQGSNVLASDEGAPGLVIRAKGPLRILRIEGEEIEVAATSSLDDLSLHASRQGWAGLEFAAGLPGTVGGATAGNAGAFGGSIGDLVVRARVIDRHGMQKERSRDGITWRYRASSLATQGDTLLTATLRLGRGRPADLLATREKNLAARRHRHPDWRRVPCAGSVFKNPPGGPAAGWLLEQAGAKTLRRGSAAVWPDHANIIVRERTPGRAMDVYHLALEMARLVRTRFGIALLPELRLLGSFPPWNQPG